MRARVLAFVIVQALLWPAILSAAEPFDHGPWSRLLDRYVDDEGRVAYRELAANDRPALDAYLAALAAARPDEWPRADRIAFWLNAYNAIIVNAVLNGYSAESLLSRYSIFSRYEPTVAGEKRTPDTIEKRILGPLGENRIHFALVCASSSCPKLSRKAYVGETLDGDLEKQARRFVNDPTRNRIRIGEEEVELSMIFKWYRDDFGGSDESVRDFVARYLPGPEAEYLRQQRPDVEYLDYDWSMNAQPGQRPPAD